MKIEVLYFDGCLTYESAANTLRAVLAEEGMEAEVQLVAVNSDEEAGRLRFSGSPTIRVDGEDFRDEVRALLEEGAQLVDVLPREEYEDEHLPKAINIPLKELDRETTAKLKRYVPVIVYCHDYQ
jgi:hypothetical protein